MCSWNREKRLIGSVTVALLLLPFLGCAESGWWSWNQTSRAADSAGPAAQVQPTPDEVARMLEPNVLGIRCFYDPFNPWIWNGDHTRVRGVKINALYLQGPNYTGVFGDGTICPRLFVSTRDLRGRLEYRLVKEWAFDVEQAMPFRAKKRMEAGWGYALFLTWGDVDLSGRSIRLTVNFERADGLVISGSKKDFRVPKPSST